MEKLRYLLFFVVLSLCTCDAYKILVVFSNPNPSHGILGDNMVKHLLSAGHEVTYITPYIETLKNKTKAHLVDVGNTHKILEVAKDIMDLKQILEGAVESPDFKLMFELVSTIGDMTLSNPNVQKLLRDPKQKFDVIIAEFMFNELFST
ncbi:uncharacterized protein LOC111363235, partial [Spodoptera litura]|uniref:Uncharacterized protein LOC111363235 n=1 Tax=Spodoptera litura TaxID=69820 RepID=A0A9J7EQB3_SPOLT